MNKRSSCTITDHHFMKSLLPLGLSYSSNESELWLYAFNVSSNWDELRCQIFVGLSPPYDSTFYLIKLIGPDHFLKKLKIVTIVCETVI